jgi:RNA polymerase sigma-70 factor (ECF subfamily)
MGGYSFPPPAEAIIVRKTFPADLRYPYERDFPVVGSGRGGRNVTERAQPRTGWSAAETAAADGDAELVARAREDRAEFGLLYARYVGSIYRYCYRALGSREAAEDATSQTFTAALAALPRYREGSFRGWLFAIARNAVADTRRRRPALPFETARTMPDVSPNPEEQAVAAEARANLRAALARLTPDQRDVVELRLAGLTGPEIARALGRRPEAVKSTQFRAYGRLRELLGSGPEEESHAR